MVYSAEINAQELQELTARAKRDGQRVEVRVRERDGFEPPRVTIHARAPRGGEYVLHTERMEPL